MVHEEEVIKPRKIVTTSKPKGDYFRKALEVCQREVVEEAPKKTKALAHLEKCVKSLAKPTKKIAKEPKEEKKEVAHPKVAKVYKTPRKSNTSSDTWTSVSTKASKAPRPVKLTQEQIMRNELSGNLPRLYEDLNVIRDACRTTLSGGDLDLMFIMDCTSSMSSWISTCQQEIMKIVNKIKDENDCKVRISFVGYTDFDQQYGQLYSIQDFTEDVDKFSKFVYNVRARGGGDAAEDMCGGFEKAIR